MVALPRSQKDWSRVLGEAKKRLKKFGKDARVWAKKSEKELVRASRIGKLQLDIAGINLQKEKVYYELGKRVAYLGGREKKLLPVLGPYWKKIRGLETGAREKKRALSEIKRKGQR